MPVTDCGGVGLLRNSADADLVVRGWQARPGATCNGTAIGAPSARARLAVSAATMRSMAKFIIGVIVGIVLIIWLIAQCVGGII
jgi:hypothetical protein